jgi:uncharacterized membrane protein
VFFIFFSPSQSVLAEDYYADIAIYVDDSGYITIDGITNHPDLLVENTEKYTYKKQSYWLLNISKEEIFSNYIFRLTLPEDSSINYIKTSGTIRIEEDLGNLIIKGFGENKSFSVVVQYQTKKSAKNTEVLDIDTTVLIIALLLIITIFLIFILITKIIGKHMEKGGIPSKEIHGFNLNGLTKRQKKIMELLIERNRPLTQTEIQQELKFPKAAISRNIHSLEIKGLIEIEKIGMSNLIKVKKNDF